MSKPEALIYALVVLAALAALIARNSWKMIQAIRRDREALKAIARKEPEI